MTDRDLFYKTLGLSEPWEVKDVRLDLGGRRVELEIGVKAVTLWGQDSLMLPIEGYEERTWRHLDTMQFETVLRARVSTLFVENIGLLESKIPQERYKHLTTQALEIVQKSDGLDLLLSDDEGRQLRDGYARKRVDLPDLQRALFSLKSSSGIEIDFEVCIGDGGEPFDERSPYELRDGKGFNSDLYIEVE